jgi:hypothetical protein
MSINGTVATRREESPPDDKKLRWRKYHPPRMMRQPLLRRRMQPDSTRRRVDTTAVIDRPRPQTAPRASVGLYKFNPVDAELESAWFQRLMRT